MKHFTHSVKVSGSTDGNLVLYLQDEMPILKIKERPLILICPGGGYGITSDREAEPLAFAFLSMGYHAAVLRYSCAPARYPVALHELANAMVYLRQNAKAWHVLPDKIFVLGCSAGGHLAACLGVFWNRAFLADGIGLAQSERALLKPNGMILCYPVITSDTFAETGSFHHLLGDGWEHSEKRAFLSLENQVSVGTPPAFLWHTYPDRCVPVENSLLFVSALRAHKIPAEFHMYGKGGHGLSLANQLTEAYNGDGRQDECASWLGLAHTWIEEQSCKP